jgi:general secretion pathway protein I
MIHRNRTEGGQTGFTLLEVMIAMAILALVAVAFLRALASSVRLVDESVQISMATLLAKERMAELESRGFPAPGDSSGAGGEAFPSFRWEHKISTTEIPNIRKAVVRVLWKEGDLQRNMELTAYFARR